MELPTQLDRIESMLTELLRRTEKKPKQVKIKDTRTLEEQIEPYKGKYAESLIKDFILYWSEKDKRGTPRWQKEKTWEIAMRLERRKRQLEEWQYQREQKQKLKTVDETPTQREIKPIQTNTGFQSLGSLFEGRVYEKN